LISLLPVIPFIVVNALKDSVWIKTPDPDFLQEYFTRYFGGDVISVVYVILFFSGLLFLTKQKEWHKQSPVYLAIFILLFVYLLPYFRSLLDTPMIVPRYTIGGLPLIILIIAAGLAAIKHNTVKRLTLIVVIILSAKVLFFDKDYYGGIHKQQYRQAIEYVNASHKDIPVYACHHIPDTTYRRYPIEDVVTEFPTGYFSNGVCYMIGASLLSYMQGVVHRVEERHCLFFDFFFLFFIFVR